MTYIIVWNGYHITILIAWGICRHHKKCLSAIAFATKGSCITERGANSSKGNPHFLHQKSDCNLPVLLPYIEQVEQIFTPASIS